MSVIIGQEDLTSKIVIGGVGYWESKRPGDGIPARTDFDPLFEIPTLVRFMMLKDVQRAPLDFRYRLVGTGLLNHMTKDWTGHWMSQVDYQRSPSTIWDYHKQVAETGLPLFIRPNYVGPHKDHLAIESAMLPLAADHRTVDMIMIFIEFMRSDDDAPRPVAMV